MKATGIVRNIDDLGRAVIPVELRRSLHIEPRDDIEIYMDADNIVLSKHHSSCLFCDSEESLTEFHNKMICANCKSGLAAVK